MNKIEFTAPLEQQPSSIGWFNIIYLPESVKKQLDNLTNLRVQCTFNNSSVAHISIKTSGDLAFVVVNQQLRKQLKITHGDPVHVCLEKETSEYGMPMPDELALMLAEDDRANDYFHALTPGKQRSLIYMVIKVKSEDARIRKALAIVEHLNEFSGMLDYKGLNEKMKEVNQRFR